MMMPVELQQKQNACYQHIAHDMYPSAAAMAGEAFMKEIPGCAHSRAQRLAQAWSQGQDWQAVRLEASLSERLPQVCDGRSFRQYSIARLKGVSKSMSSKSRTTSPLTLLCSSTRTICSLLRNFTHAC